MLEAQGLRVHTHTSPHLVRFHERIRIDGRTDFGEEASWCRYPWKRWSGSMTASAITFFEITGAAMFLAFSRVTLPMRCVLEVGLGGKYRRHQCRAQARHDHHPAGGA